MKEALKLALEALESCGSGHITDGGNQWYDEKLVDKAIITIKEALAQPEQERCVGCEACIDTACGRDECPKGWPKAAQPEQEPVAWMNPHGGVSLRLFTGLEKNSYTIPLYTTPPQRKPLTDVDWKARALKAEKAVEELAYAGFQRKPLTDEQIYELWTEQGLANSYDIYSLKEHVRRAARAIEAAHGIKE